MSGPKTLDDLITEWCKEASLGEGLLEAPVFWGLVEKHAKHYHIIPGANAMVTPQGLGGAAKAIAETQRPWTGYTYDQLDEDQQVILLNEARAALEAAGIEVVNERVEVGVYQDYIRFKYVEGDTLFIKKGGTK